MKQQKLKHCSFLLYNLYMENKIQQQNDYNALQLSLPIDLGVKIDEDDMVVFFLKALEGVNLSKYFKKGKCRERKGYDRCKLLKAALFAYMLCDNDLRSMESLCRYDIRFMYIMGEERPSFMTFERLLKDF
ncbi:transposase [Faecalibacillus faecis]|uniref:transposase n=1 Tax=Faecalibacillus faecis TaxID=1982628 RepID=UPI003AB36C54